MGLLCPSLLLPLNFHILNDLFFTQKTATAFIAPLQGLGIDEPRVHIPECCPIFQGSSHFLTGIKLLSSLHCFTRANLNLIIVDAPPDFTTGTKSILNALSSTSHCIGSHAQIRSIHITPSKRCHFHLPCERDKEFFSIYSCISASLRPSMIYRARIRSASCVL